LKVYLSNINILTNHLLKKNHSRNAAIEYSSRRPVDGRGVQSNNNEGNEESTGHTVLTIGKLEGKTVQNVR